MRRRLWIFPVIFIAVVLVLSIGALFVIWAITEKNVGAVDLNRLDLKSRLDELRQTLQFLIVAAGLFAIAQGAAAFFNALSFTNQAEDVIKDITNQARDVKVRFPIYARMEAARREAYASLADIFSDPFFLDWRTSAYEKLTALDRQKLLSVVSILGIELMPYPGEPEEYVRNLRLLANFYASKHRYEAHASRAQAQWTDLERAEYYLTLAIEAARKAGKDDSHLITDLGVVYMEFSKEKRLVEAEKQFLESARRKRNQQRAYYNLALVARYREDWEKAICLYKEALCYDNWESRPLDEMRCAIIYNQACLFARYSYKNAIKREDLIALCLAALNDASRFGLVGTSLIEEDLTTPDGAFFHLDHQTKMKIEEMKGALCQKKAPPPTMSWEQLVRAARNKLLGRA